MDPEVQSNSDDATDLPEAEKPGCGGQAVVLALGLIAIVAIMVGPWANTDVFLEGRVFVVGALSGALFIVGGVLVRRGLWWGDLLSLGSLAGLLLGGAFVLAQPGARHPILMSLVGVFAIGFGVGPTRRLVPGRSGFAIAGWSVLSLLLVGLGASDVPLVTRVRLSRDSMDAKAAAVLATPDLVNEGGFFDCYSGSHFIGPFEYRCGRTGAENGGWVAFYLYEAPGMIDEGTASLIYAPGGLPGDGCSNHLVGPWYETYSPRGTDGCNWGVGG